MMDFFLRYEYRLQNEGGTEQRHPLSSNHSNGIRRRINGGNRGEPQSDGSLNQFIREETNFRRMQSERLSVLEYYFEQSVPASLQFIAKFRMKQQTNPQRIDSKLLEEQSTCMICLVEFELDDQYERWPCSLAIPHIFHSDCMLNMLRRKNTCPICRHPVEYDQPTNESFAQFFNRLIF